MVYRPAQVYNGSGWDDVGDKRMLTHDHSGGADGTNIPQSSVTDLTSDLASKLDLAGGKILQIVRATDGTNRSTTSTSFADANISVTITPQLGTSAIVLIYSAFLSISTTTTGDHRAQLQITDSSNNAISGSELRQFGLNNYLFSGTAIINPGVTLVAYATPATTAATTYKVRYKAVAATNTVTLANASNTGQLYAIEVSA